MTGVWVCGCVYLTYCNITPDSCITSTHAALPTIQVSDLTPFLKHKSFLCARRVTDFVHLKRTKTKSQLSGGRESGGGSGDTSDFESAPPLSQASPPLLQERRSDGTVRVPDRRATKLQLQLYLFIGGLFLGLGVPGKEGSGRALQLQPRAVLGNLASLTEKGSRRKARIVRTCVGLWG